jgi:polar amino acid transport system permease protein
MINFHKPYLLTPSLTIALTLIGLVCFLWIMTIPLSFAPDPIGQSASQFADGTKVTVLLTTTSGAIGLLLGIAIGIGKLSSILAIRWFCNFYVWLIRGTPLLLQILFVWLVFPIILPSSFRISDITSAIIALSINIGAYNAEAIRAGILAVPKGQIEAARALGFSPFLCFFDIIFPQSLRVALPALANNLASLVKDSSLAYVISVVELTMVGYRVQAESFQPIPVLMTSAFLYLLLTTAFTTITSALETHLDITKK